MQFALNELQQEIQKTCRGFAREALLPNARRWDREHAFPAEAVRQLGELGLMGMVVPEQWGGAGVDQLSYAVAMEEVARGCASTAVVMSVSNSLWCDPVLRAASDEQKRVWLAPFARGEMIGAFALTEPQSGSDAGEMKTTARLDGDHWVIDGSKCFITNGPVADAVLVFAITDPSRRSRGISAFLVPTETPGLRRGRTDEKLGIRAAGTCSLFFEQCRVPRENLLGREGAGYKLAMDALDGGRIGIGAQAVGIARAAFEEARDYSRERRTFGQSISSHQAIQFMLADMATQIDAARLLVWRAAALKDSGARFGREAAMAKLFASEACNRVATKAVQILGGPGYMTDHDAERHFRDARITEIYEGTSEIQRMVIAASLLRD